MDFVENLGVKDKNLLEKNVIKPEFLNAKKILFNNIYLVRTAPDKADGYHL